MPGFKVTRVPGDYYAQPLDFRRQCLGAASISHLCKSIVMENTKDERPFPQGLPGATDDPWSSKYFMIIVQVRSQPPSQPRLDMTPAALPPMRLNHKTAEWRTKSIEKLTRI